MTASCSVAEVLRFNLNNEVPAGATGMAPPQGEWHCRAWGAKPRTMNVPTPAPIKAAKVALAITSTVAVFVPTITGKCQNFQLAGTQCLADMPAAKYISFIKYP